MARLSMPTSILRNIQLLLAQNNRHTNNENILQRMLAREHNITVKIKQTK